MNTVILEEFRDFLINDSANNAKSVYDTFRNCWATVHVADDKHIFVSIRDNNDKYTAKPLHNLLAQAFLEKPTPDCDVVHHINHNPSDNRLENLMWMTRPEHARLHTKGDNHPMWGKHHSEKTKKKMSESMSNAWTDERRREFGKSRTGEKHPLYGKFGKDHNRSKAVVQLTLDGEFVKRWDSMTDVSKRLGYSQGNISQCCKGKYKSAYKYKWVYESDYKGTISPIQLRIPFE